MTQLFLFTNREECSAFEILSGKIFLPGLISLTYNHKSYGTDSL